MINIGIFTYARTGSNWLGHLLNNDNSIYYEEIFCSNYLEYFRKLIPIFQAYQIPQNLIDTFINIYDQQHIKTYVDIPNLQKYLDTKNIYSIDILYTLQKETHKLNKNFIFKIFNEHCRKEITLENLNRCTDYNIINYRQNALESYISFHKAFDTEEWVLGFYKDKVPKDYSIKIDIEHFMTYKHKIINFLHQAYNTLHNPIVIDYENIHKHKDHNIKKQYVRHILHNGGLDIDLSNKQIFQKQNDNLLSHITNYTEIKNIIHTNEHIITIKDIITNAS